MDGPRRSTRPTIVKTNAGPTGTERTEGTNAEIWDSASLHAVRPECRSCFVLGSASWLPDDYSQIFRPYVFGPAGLKDYGSAKLHCKI